MKLSWRLVLGVALSAIFVVPGKAQISVYGEATDASLQFKGTPHMPGGTFGLFKTKPVGPVAMGADFRGVIVKRGGTQGSIDDTKLAEGQFGFRISAGQHVLPLGLMPYGEALLGLGYWRGGLGVLRQDGNHALLQGVAGIDVPVHGRFDWRIVEFSYARVGAYPGSIDPISVSTGFVYHFPAAPHSR